ncbi:MAG: DUF3990 domain-containing protein [Oscillospiraceae bacterium]|nr:DUF3990 domain-containing protein [Oscillospiraceae bacterium]
MLLYHGSNTEVREPRLLETQRELDFGTGFYTTSDYEQAKKWAVRTKKIRNNGASAVSFYEFDTDRTGELLVKRFLKPDLEWLEFVAANRRMHRTDIYDLIIGPVADDRTVPTLVLYLDGYISAENAIERLLPMKLKDQYTFKSQKALDLLTFTKVVYV